MMMRVALVTVLVVLTSSVTVVAAKSSHRIKGGRRARNGEQRQLQIPVVKENNSRKRNAGLWQVFDQVVRMFLDCIVDQIFSRIRQRLVNLGWLDKIGDLHGYRAQGIPYTSCPLLWLNLSLY
jgi:hypothetical protein